MHKRLISVLVLLALFIVPKPAYAQEYYFNLEKLTVDVYWNEDGTQSLDYNFLFNNDPSAHSIEFVDLGLPNSNFDVNTISATVDEKPVAYISESEFQGTGSDGVAVALGNNAILAGQRGSVRIFVGSVSNVLYLDDDDKNYASAVFSPAYFESRIVKGNTDLTVTYHLPPGVLPEEPRWHTAPAGFPSEPATGIDQEGRIFYSWHNPSASASTRYQFGASFPVKYVPSSAITRVSSPSWLRNIRLDVDNLIPIGCISFIVFIIGWSAYSGNKRKFQYLPPKIKIEGHGIKRGLTAVEAAILLERPLDKVMTMILFSAIKKGAAEVVRRDPLEIKVAQPIPDQLHDYEKDFLLAFRETGAKRTSELQKSIVALVQEVATKMKGFSRRETIEYYQDITKRAWEQVEAADTPEVKSQQFDELLGWTMLDGEFEDRTRDVFRHQPVFIPTWWGRYDPSYSPKTLSRPSSAPTTPSSGGQISLPNLPGADFAASIVTGVQGFSSKVVGNISDFTTKVTTKTNPLPAPSTSRYSGSSRSGGGCACACACACAGCACACAGGGR